MSRLRYTENFRVGCYHPGDQPNQLPQPNPVAEKLRCRAKTIEETYAGTGEGDLNEAVQLRRQAEVIERQEAIPLLPSVAVTGNNCGGVINRDEHVVARPWYWFLSRPMLLIGGPAILAWFIFGGYQWGYHVNPCTPPCSQSQQQTPASKVQADTSGLEKQIAELRSAVEKRQTQSQSARLVVPRSVDLSSIERGLNRLADALPGQTNPVPSPSLATRNQNPKQNIEPRQTMSDEERAQRSWEAWRVSQNSR